jgi:acetylserotonin N-methyltransferase
MSTIDSHLVWGLLTAFRHSKVLFAAVELGLFDSIDSEGAAASELANRLKCDPSSLTRLLDACVGLKLLMRREDRYHLTNEARVYLCQQSDANLIGYIRYSNRVAWKLWEHLEDAVREGSHRWQQAYGWDGPIFSHFFKTDAALREFLLGMHGFGVMSSPTVVRAVDLRPFTHFVDLGGGSGHLAVAACEAYPQLQATVFDLPEAIPFAKEMLDRTPVKDRINTIAGDFFTDPLPSADLYGLGRIVHDWSEPKIDRLLRRIYQVLPPRGGLLIAEKQINPDRSGPDWAQMQDLNMLCCTEGRERALAEYESLLRGIGFTEIIGRVTDGPLDVVLAIKA